MSALPGETTYPHLFSEWHVRNTTVSNRIVFAPTCPTWVADPYEGVCASGNRGCALVRGSTREIRRE